MSKEHFIKNIEIKNFKCFKDFRAEGFGRVNLIGGKNNVGKTAFMEACFLSQSVSTEDLFGKLLEIKSHRDIVNNLLSNSNRENDIRQLIKDNFDLSIFVEGKGGFSRDSKWSDGLVRIELFNNILSVYTKFTHIKITSDESRDEETGEYIEYNEPKDYKLSELINLLDVYFDSTKKRFSLNFISPYSNSNEELENIIGQSKLDNKYDELNQYLSDVFNVKSIDIIKNKPMLKIGNEYRELSYFGQGIKTFINIISSILLLKDDVMFIDEIENGIHYTNLDKLWEIILTISKQQNVQVFATTHSKECIESYARVAKGLEDEEITMTLLAQNPKNELKALVYNDKMFYSELEQNHEVRGW